MNDNDIDKELDTLYAPVAELVRGTIDQMIQYIDSNKEQLKVALSDMASRDSDPNAKYVLENTDATILAFFIPVLEESIRKFELAMIGVKAIGQAGRGWDHFYTAWEDAKETVTAREEAAKPTSH